MTPFSARILAPTPVDDFVPYFDTAVTDDDLD